MTTYKKYSIKNSKNRKTRKMKKIKKMKKMKGGSEDDIKKNAIDKVKGEISKTKTGKRTSIVIDFLEKRSNDKNYGNKSNKFYENININKDGITMTESISGVEELFEIFKKELDFVKATDADKDAKKKEIKSNLKKTKEIIIEYDDKSGNFTINNEQLPVPVAPVITPSQVVAPVITQYQVVAPVVTQEVSLTPEPVIPPEPVLSQEVLPEPTGQFTEESIEESIQETAINVVSDTVVKEIVSKKIDDKNPLINDAILDNLNNKIRTQTKELTKELNKNSKFVKKTMNEIKYLKDKNIKLEAERDKLKNKNEELKLQAGIKTGGNYSKKESNAKKIREYNKTIAEKDKEIAKNNDDIIRATKNIIEIEGKNTVINAFLTKINSQKEYYLKLLNRAYDILIQKLSESEVKSGKLGFNIASDKEGYEIIKANIKTIKDKINKLQSGYINNFLNINKPIRNTVKKVSSIGRTIAENVRNTVKKVSSRSSTIAKNVRTTVKNKFKELRNDFRKNYEKLPENDSKSNTPTNTKTNDTKQNDTIQIINEIQNPIIPGPIVPSNSQVITSKNSNNDSTAITSPLHANTNPYDSAITNANKQPTNTDVKSPLLPQNNP